jgi:hypothetical protein
VHWTCHHSGGSSSIDIRKGVSETVPWTFQIVDVVFVSRASTYSLYFECGYLDCLDWKSWHHEWQLYVDSTLHLINMSICSPTVTNNMRFCFVSHFTGTLLKLRLNIQNNNLRRPFEDCEFTPLLYRITEFSMPCINNKTIRTLQLVFDRVIQKIKPSYNDLCRCYTIRYDNVTLSPFLLPASTSGMRVTLSYLLHHIPNTFPGSSWPWPYGSWIYNYLYNQWLSPLLFWVRIWIRARCTTLCDKVCQW